MANADELCQLARLGQTAKMQKYLQTHSVDVNALNLYGESALSTATYHNQLPSVECLLTNRADPKVRLSAGHTSIHIACQLGHIAILQTFLAIKKLETESDEDAQRRQEKHIYDCVRIKDNAGLTPIHWAATQETVSKRQKVFAYLDQRMPGVLDSRYNVDWFQSWARTHPWVTAQKTTRPVLAVPSIALPSKLLTHGAPYAHHERSSLPSPEMASSSRMSVNEYEYPSRRTAEYYDEISGKYARLSPTHPSKARQSLPASGLPPTPTTSYLEVSYASSLQAHEPHLQSPTAIDSRGLSHVHIQSRTSTPQKPSYTKRLTSMIAKLSLSPLSDRATHRTERAQVMPLSHFPTSPGDTVRPHDYEDMLTPISSKRPSHNLLSNIVPSTTTPSTERSSRQSSKPFASFGFDTSLHARGLDDGTKSLSSTGSYRHTGHQHDLESCLEDDDENYYQTNRLDYLCESASSLGISTPGVYAYDA